MRWAKQKNYLFNLVIVLAPLSLAWTTAFAADSTGVRSEMSAAQWVARAQAAMRVDPKASEAAALEALGELSGKPDPDLEIRARLILCDFQSEREVEAAAQQADAAWALLPKAQRAGLRAGILSCKADIAEIQGDHKQARQLFDEAVTIAGSAQDDEMLAGALFGRGSLIGASGDYSASLVDLRRAQALYEKTDMQSHALTVRTSIGGLYVRIGEYEQALRIYEEAVQRYRAGGMRRDMSVMLQHVGRINGYLQRWDAARAAFTQARTVAREIDYERAEAYALRGLSEAATQLGDPAGALRILDDAERLQRTTTDALLGARILLERGKALHRLQRLGEADETLFKASQLLTQSDTQLELEVAYAELAAVNAALGRWRAAYGYRLQSQQIQQTLFANRFDQRFATLKLEYDLAAQEKENQFLLRENQINAKALEQERSVRRWQAAAILLTLLLLAIVALIAWRQYRTSVRMRDLAMTDDLTGVANRRHTVARIERLLTEPRGKSCAIAIVDIDHFKSINDRHGHPEGDAALRAIVTRLAEVVAAPAFVGRLGGEEFVVVTPNTELEQAKRAADSYRLAIMAMDARRWNGEQPITVSIGVSIGQPGADTLSSVLHRADVALYAAKSSGRNCVITEIDAAILGVNRGRSSNERPAAS